VKKNLFKYLGNGALIAGALTGGYALARIYILRASLPPGVCPVVSYKGFLYAGIAFCVLSFVFSIFERQFKIKNNP
jgi:hypothetical protein